MAEKSGEFLKKTRTVIAGFGSKAGKALQDVKEQTAPITEKVSGQVKSTSKKAADAVECKIKDVKAAAEQKKEEKLTVVQLSGSKVKILLPNGYRHQKSRNILKPPLRAVGATPEVYYKKTDSSENTVQVFRLSPKEAADYCTDYTGVSVLINKLHQDISDNQGIIEVKNGTCIFGFPYIYSIIKTLHPEHIGGVCYTLVLTIYNDTDIIRILGEFQEIGTTGGREAICMELARRAGLTNVSEDGLQGWASDPYDPEFKKGILKNLAEKEGLDALFPCHPLSQAHEFLLAALENQFVKIKHDDSDKNEAAAGESVDASLSDDADTKKKTEKEILLNLFVDECNRIRYPITVGQDEEKPRHGSATKEEAASEMGTLPVIKPIATRSAIKIIYYLMSADGEVLHNEEEKFDAIGAELDPNFAENKEDIIKECQNQMGKAIDPEDYFGILQDGVETALSASVQTADTFITPKLLVWDLLTVAYSDESYDDAERQLLNYIVRKLNIDKAVFLEMESSILTMMDLEKELVWIKTTDRPYLTIEAMVNEIADRKNVIFESVKDLIAL